MRHHESDREVLGPWSLTTSRTFQEGFTPAALPAERSEDGDALHTVFRVEVDWSRAQTTVARTARSRASPWPGRGTWRLPPRRSPAS